MARKIRTSVNIARILHSMRDSLKVKYRDLTPPASRAEMEARSLELYGNVLGPTIDGLRAEGRSWEQIITGAAKPGGADLGF